MIRFAFIVVCICLSCPLIAQYYYKDIIATRQTVARMAKYKAAGVRSVVINSFESDGERTEDFEGRQLVSGNYTSIETMFKTPLAGESHLTTFFNSAGQLSRSVDTTDGAGSQSEYRYDNTGKLSTIINISTSPGGHMEKEEHNWFYNNNGEPEKMVRIKNAVDSIVVTFVTDENGKTVEEHSRRNGQAQSSFYYYYDESNRLSDVVTYNLRAKRLLPIYVFEYNTNDLISSMMVVPEGSDDYQRWVYEYNEQGLKTRETCYNKRRQIVGRVEYVYRRER